MKKIILGTLIALIVLLFSGTALAKKNSVAPQAKKPTLEKIEFIHWKNDFAKPTCNNNGICEPELGEKKNCPDCKNGNGEEPEPGPTCYSLEQFGKKFLQWRDLPVDYVINPDNPDGLSQGFVESAISAGAEEWDNWTTAELFNDSYSVDYGVAYGIQDYQNAITFDDYSLAGVIGVASVWWNPATKSIVEFDIMFDIDFVWGDASADPAVMDLQNIATHELGHGVGLGDVYEIECSAVTMYGYSDYGEIQKKDLEQPDILGVQTLYGF